jgi:LSD1 subclass zinc finger protein
MAESSCPNCNAAISPGDQTCQGCGKPLSLPPRAKDIPCKVCGAAITAYTLTCPECGEGGYPALRPRKGKGFKGPAQS